MKNNRSIIVNISSINDLDKITNHTKYININITDCDHEVINFFLRNGESYLYSEIINNVSGYIYVSYQEFLKAENIINGIYANMPNDLTPLEMARYLYTTIPNYVSFDINLDREKNESSNLSLISSVNNIWGSIANGRVNDKSISKIYYYLCRRLGLDIDLLISNITNDIYTELHISKMSIITDLFNDIPFVQAKMKTLHFGTYNDDLSLDQTVKYIKNYYSDELIDKALKNIDYTTKTCIENILTKTTKILPIDKIKPTELSIIYNLIFAKYCPKYQIKINNLFLNTKDKNHFIIISHDDEHYSYNYKKKAFVKVTNLDLIDNLNNGRIGLYTDEFIPNLGLN